MGKQIQSLERGLFLLESILLSSGPVTSNEVANRLGVHKSTVSHLASTLMDCGYLEKEPGSLRLRPGRAAFRLARALQPTTELLDIARPLIENLAGQTGETSHLAELRGRHAFFLMNCASKMALRVETENGMYEMVHSTAVGKALLSGLVNDEIIAMYQGVEMARCTGNTITSMKTLLNEVAETREYGVAYDREEQTPGTGCIASPVFGPWKQVIAAVGISGPVERVYAKDSTHFEAVMQCAKAISNEFAKAAATATGKANSKRSARSSGSAKQSFHS